MTFYGLAEDLNTDSDDANAKVNPDANGICDEVDKDSDKEVDEVVSETFYSDADGDGYGSALYPMEGRAPPIG